MKNFFISLLALVGMASSSFAASDFLLEIDGVKGEVFKPSTKSTNGKITLTGLPSDATFKCKLDCDGKTYTIILGADLDGDGTVDRVLDSPAASDVKSPRDRASGQATGKRMHKPMTFYCVLMPDGSVSKCTSEAQANAKCTAIRESPTKASTGGTAKSWLPSNFRIELKEVLVSSISTGSGSPTPTSISIAFQKIEMK